MLPTLSITDIENFDKILMSSLGHITKIWRNTSIIIQNTQIDESANLKAVPGFQIEKLGSYWIRLLPTFSRI